MKDIKAFQIRLPKESWAFLKRAVIDQETSMNEIIISLVEKYKNKCEKKLTQRDTVVS